MVGRHVTTGNDDQVADRLLAGNQVESNPLERQDHGAVQDTLMSQRDSAFTVQVRQRLQIQRDRVSPTSTATVKPAGLRRRTLTRRAPSIDQVAEAFGVSSATLYRRLPAKAEQQ